MKYYYFVSYVCENSQGNMGYGNITFDTCSKLRDKRDLDFVIKFIENDETRKVMNLNVVLLDTE